MARTINRYPVNSVGNTRLIVPEGTTPLSVSVEGGSLYVHAWEPHPAKGQEMLDLRTAATWTVLDDSELSYHYLGTVRWLEQMELHVFHVWPHRKDAG